MSFDEFKQLNLEIFWDENRAYVLVYSVYALVVLGVASYIERRLQISDAGTGTIATANAIIWAISVALFTLGMLVTGWLSDLFGGELGAFVVMTLSSFALLLLAGRWCLSHFEIRLGSPNLFCSLSAITLLIPYVGFHVFMFILASADWRH